MNYPAILEKVADQVKNYMREQENPALLYHNLEHTESIVAAAQQITGYYRLSEKEQFIVLAAAWFHDVGYFEEVSNHEAIGAAHAGAFLKQAGVDDDTIAAVQKCILATKMPQSPESFPEQILCDADLFNLGTDDFEERSKRLRKEYEILHQTPVSKVEWWKKTIHLMEQHHYFTEYCRGLLTEKKEQNLAKWRKRVEEAEGSAAGQIPGDAAGNELDAEKNKKKDDPARTIETMFRVTSTNSQRLSDQADSKAHILITVNSIILSILLTFVVPKGKDHSDITLHLGVFAFPLGMLVLVNLITIIFSILTTRPQVPSGTFTPDDLKGRKVNLLFFGNFYRMNFKDYSDGMFQIMADKKYLHLTLLRDIYLQGVVLGRKYRMLKRAYNIFMYGLILSVLTFFLLMVFFSGKL